MTMNKWEKISANHIPDKRLVSRINEEFLKLFKDRKYLLLKNE